jgi:hypothetical protein
MCVSHYSCGILKICAIKNTDTLLGGGGNALSNFFYVLLQKLYTTYCIFLHVASFTDNFFLSKCVYVFPESAVFFSDLTCLVSCVISVNPVHA